MLIGAILLAAVLTGAGAFFAWRVVTAPLRGAERLAQAFEQGSITESFLASIPVARDAGRGRLEVATLEATEVLRREDERSLAWDLVPLGTTTVEIRVPVVYRYHLELADAWSVEVEGTVCRVTAPRLRPTVPVAIRTDGLEKRVDEGWARFDGAAQLAELERSLTAHLTATARHADRVALAREPARRTVAAFVSDWLLSHEAWGEGEIDTILVRFADETEWDEGPTLAFGDGG